MKKTLFFLLGCVAGLLSLGIIKKVTHVSLLPEDWYKDDNMQHWG